MKRPRRTPTMAYASCNGSGPEGCGWARGYTERPERIRGIKDDAAVHAGLTSHEVVVSEQSMVIYDGRP